MKRSDLAERFLDPLIAKNILYIDGKRLRTLKRIKLTMRLSIII